MSYLNGQSLLVNAMSGLTSTFSTLAQNNSSGGKISLEDITNPSSTVLSQLGYNTSFLQYLSNNFNNIDEDNDGQIDAKDLSKLTQTMQTQGLTYQEIAQLCASGNMSSSLTDTVLNYFNKIDKNGDGRVTSEEITAFSYESERQKMDTEYNGFKSSSMSVFYGSESADDETSSLIDNMYPDLSNQG